MLAPAQLSARSAALLLVFCLADLFRVDLDGKSTHPPYQWFMSHYEKMVGTDAQVPPNLRDRLEPHRVPAARCVVGEEFANARRSLLEDLTSASISERES